MRIQKERQFTLLRQCLMVIHTFGHIMSVHNVPKFMRWHIACV